MIFGEVDLDQAEGAILAHSLSLPDGKLAKGCVLDAAAIAKLNAAGVMQVTVARLDAEDQDENTAANVLGQALATSDMPATTAHSGRSNLSARRAGVLRVDEEKVLTINSVDEGITLATLPDFARVEETMLVATAKIIPYAVPKIRVAEAAAAAKGCLRLHPFRHKTYDLILTHTPSFRDSLLTKAQQAVAARVSGLGGTMGQVQTLAHDADHVATGLKACTGDVVLLLGASASSDRHDVIPSGIVQAGGTLLRYGMPVDPGNLLVMAQIGSQPVIGLPGCARAPALNGTDWILERVAADIPVSSQDIARMGVGGLLKEIPSRRQPREARARDRHGVAILLLAAGQSSRMRGAHKLLQDIDGAPLLRRSAQAACAAGLRAVHVVVPPDAQAHAAALQDLNVVSTVAQSPQDGLSSSLKCGLKGLPRDIAAVIVALADMPDIKSSHFNALAAAHAPNRDALIVAPIAPNGKRGNPVLFDARFIPDLLRLTGDQGAKTVIEAARDVLVEIASDAAVLTDLDTPEAWRAWRRSRQGGSTKPFDAL